MFGCDWNGFLEFDLRLRLFLLLYLLCRDVLRCRWLCLDRSSSLQWSITCSILLLVCCFLGRSLSWFLLKGAEVDFSKRLELLASHFRLSLRLGAFRFLFLFLVLCLFLENLCSI